MTVSLFASTLMSDDRAEAFPQPHYRFSNLANLHPTTRDLILLAFLPDFRRKIGTVRLAYPFDATPDNQH
jgi:hypothetical protein